MTNVSAPHLQRGRPAPLRGNGLHTVTNNNTRSKAKKNETFHNNAAETSTPYICPELQRNPGIRNERFAAFALPSRVGNQLRWPDGSVTNLEGTPISKENP